MTEKWKPALWAEDLILLRAKKMKTVIINGSPRKNFNTAKILKSAMKGAESIGDEVLYIDLYDLSFTGCRSCLACKRVGIDNPCKCYCKDDLSPVLEKILEADRLIMGSPIYFGQPTAELRALLERLVFPALSYKTLSSLYDGKLDIDVILTMNAGEDYYNKSYDSSMKEYFGPFGLLNGAINIYPVCDTLQVNDYSKYEMNLDWGEHKKKVNEALFPKELEKAFNIGAKKDM